jgi:hypothetical protein
MSCNSNDAMFPMVADIYYPIVEQAALGNISKRWVFDRSIICSFSSAGSSFKEELVPNIDITQDSLLVGRSKSDLRLSSLEASNAITNVIITNIRDKNCNQLYTESSGIRKNKSTIFEIASHQPFVGPFGEREYYKVVLRRSENQAADV